nr:MAG TPA: hypothetical protein [Caudoviricetes sp.]
MNLGTSLSRKAAIRQNVNQRRSALPPFLFCLPRYTNHGAQICVFIYKKYCKSYCKIPTMGV